ncbi:MAG: acyl-CoA thioesterase domain-containing protein, partial [Acidimicrobiales bacterium]
MGNSFLDGTVVHAVGDGRYEAAIAEVWNLRPLPQGGMVSALALRAMATELDDPTQRLRTAHTSFAAQVADGSVDIDVELLRRGRSMSHLRAEV